MVIFSPLKYQRKVRILSNNIRATEKTDSSDEFSVIMHLAICKAEAYSITSQKQTADIENEPVALSYYTVIGNSDLGDLSHAHISLWRLYIFCT